MDPQSVNINRRDFLRGAAALGASLYAAPSIFGQAAPDASGDLNFAMIGSGKQGQVLLDCCIRIKGIRLKAICDIWPYNQKMALSKVRMVFPDVKIYTDYKEMLATEKDLQACIVASPDFMHAEHACACLNAGLNVYCEKEMSNDLAKAREMVATARKSGKLLQIGHQRRSNPRYQLAQKIAREQGLMGRITHINGQWNRSPHLDMASNERIALDKTTLEKYGYESMQQFLNWRWYKKFAGGPIVDLGSHQIDIFSWFLGVNPKSVFATGGVDYYRDRGHEWYDNVMTIYQYETPKGAARAFYQVLNNTGHGAYYEIFLGDEASLTLSEAASQGYFLREEDFAAAQAKDALWEDMVKKATLKRLDNTAAAQAAAAADAKAAGGTAAVSTRKAVDSRAPWIITDLLGDKPYHQPHLENFFAAIRDKNVPLNCPAEVGYETAVAVLKVNESIAKGTPLDFKPEEFKV